MKEFYLVENSIRDRSRAVAEQIEHLIVENGGRCFRSHGYIDVTKVPENIDCIITLGGDGTLIRAAKDMVHREIPLFGINTGHLGYLTGVSKVEDIASAIERLMRGEYSIESRMMLSGTCLKQDTEFAGHIALNEIVVTRTLSLKPIKCKVFVNGEFLNEYAADGIIIATPTGSTAYNLSAGGPIVEPSTQMIIITPICAHTLNQRSIVLSAEDEIDIRVVSNDDSGTSVVFDGDIKAGLGKGENIRIRRSEIVTRLVKIKGGSFLDNLRSKMVSI